MAIPQKVVYYIVYKGGIVYMNMRIKQLRKALKLSQQEFADKIHISRSQLSYYESGTVSIPDRSQKEICEKFNVNIEWLKTGEGEMYQPEPQINELEYLMGKFSINTEEDEMRTRIIKALLKLDDNGWKVIEGLVDDILKDMQ